MVALPAPGLKAKLSWPPLPKTVVPPPTLLKVSFPVVPSTNFSVETSVALLVPTSVTVSVWFPLLP